MAYWITNTSFEPFVDTTNYYGKTNRHLTISGGIDTSQADDYREGVNLRTIEDIYQSSQMKILFMDGSQDLAVDPNGELTHRSSFITFGQAGDFTQFTNDSAFHDEIEGIEGTVMISNGIHVGRTVDYLINSGLVAISSKSYTTMYPIYMNGGPQFAEEAIIEPLPIPDRLSTNESVQNPARGIFAFLEAGNQGETRHLGTDLIEQRKFRDLPRVVRPFLEYDSNYIIVTGSSGEGVIKVIQIKPSAIPDPTITAKIRPCLDELNGQYLPTVTNTLDLLNAVVAGDKRPYYTRNYAITVSDLVSRDQKSSTAGYDCCYGGDSNLYGTDSIAFVGLWRGS